MIKLTIIIVFNLKSTASQFNDCKIENRLNNNFSKTNSKIQLDCINQDITLTINIITKII
ncbi:hypothetical protein CAPN004_19890 [Capnocytophaga cynodegmi]|nr:hypothetical protein CAPN004_19890 [Capnocytophaga cynodegmi]